jgi:hypothetical protein
MAADPPHCPLPAGVAYVHRRPPGVSHRHQAPLCPPPVLRPRRPIAKVSSRRFLLARCLTRDSVKLTPATSEHLCHPWPPRHPAGHRRGDRTRRVRVPRRGNQAGWATLVAGLGRLGHARVAFQPASRHGPPALGSQGLGPVSVQARFPPLSIIRIYFFLI